MVTTISLILVILLIVTVQQPLATAAAAAAAATTVRYPVVVRLPRVPIGARDSLGQLFTLFLSQRTGVHRVRCLQISTTTAATTAAAVAIAVTVAGGGISVVMAAAIVALRCHTVRVGVEIETGRGGKRAGVPLLNVAQIAQQLRQIAVAAIAAPTVGRIGPEKVEIGVHILMLLLLVVVLIVVVIVVPLALISAHWQRALVLQVLVVALCRMAVTTAYHPATRKRRRGGGA
uniref:Secreted protein n=1 Tax=Anopheles darlingi TaxID=43151 RepID=A0A2M4D6C6_ANODA